MEQYIINEDHKLSPAVVIATGLLISGFVIGFIYQLILLVL
ncbi:hypothetical protein [Natronocalculus amylovorans]|nr:hypothetical protein [Natronocalculus amylovorans]